MRSGNVVFLMALAWLFLLDFAWARSPLALVFCAFCFLAVDRLAEAK